MIPTPPVHGINLWLPSAARALQRNGVSASEAVALLRSYEPILRRRYQRNEVERAVTLVYSTPAGAPGHESIWAAAPSRIADHPFDAARLARIASNLPEADAAWLKARSPVQVEDVDTDRFLEIITNAGERVLCFINVRSQGQYVWDANTPTEQRARVLRAWSNGLTEGAWFLPQPVSGEYLELDRLRNDRNPHGRTRRAEENVNQFRFAVLESDAADMGHWLAALAQLPLPIVSITTSGNKSIHALVLINAPNKPAWDDTVRGTLLPPLKTLGADAAALTAVRLTRLPGIRRGGRLQELLFLNPSPTSEPIANFPTPSHHADFN